MAKVLSRGRRPCRVVGDTYLRGVESTLDLLLGRLPPALAASEARRLQKLESRSNGTPWPRCKDTQAPASAV